MLEHGKLEDRAKIVERLRGQMLHMSRHKFASNVCEKALVTADAESRRLLIDEIMTPKQDGISPIMGLMKDSFGSRSRCFVRARMLLMPVARLRSPEGSHRRRGRTEGAVDQQGPAASGQHEAVLECLQQAPLSQ